MTVGKHLAPELAERIRKAAKENPDLSKAELGRRFGLNPQTITRALQNESLPESKRFPVGSSVRVRIGESRVNRERTGVVVKDDLPFPWRDHREVELDAVPDGGRLGGTARVVRLPAAELKLIKPSERAESARPREQVQLFGGAP